jgi:hypothetical protein
VGSVRRHAILSASAERVWSFIGRPDALHEWFPTSSTRVEGDKRWVTLPSGIVFEERIVLIDNDLRRFQYSIIGNPLITQHVGTYDVIALSDDKCIVIYSTDIEPEVLGLAIGAAAGHGLKNLEEKFGKG